MTDLTPKQQRFVEEYLVDLNATQAAIRAGYSVKTAKEQGSQNLTKLHIREAVEVAKAKRTERTEITQDMVIEGLHKEATRDDASASHGARVAAWGHLGKHLGMFKAGVAVALFAYRGLVTDR